MTVHFSRRARTAPATALAFIFMAQSASADLLAQDVWSDWKSYLTSYGYTVTGQETMSGDTLTISDLAMTMAIPQENANVSLSIPTLSFRENSDGTVNIVYPSPMPVVIAFDGSGSDDGTGTVLVSHTGGSVAVSGDPLSMKYDYSFDTMKFELADLQVEGQPDASEAIKVEVVANALKGSATMDIASLRRIDQDYSIDSVTYAMSFDDPESDDGGQFTGQMTGLAATAAGTLPKSIDTADLPAMLKAGMKMAGAFTYQAGSSTMSGTGDGQSFQSETSSEGGSLNFSMDAETLSYDGESRNASLNFTTDQLPFPVTSEMALAGFKLALPVAKSDDPQDFAFGLSLVDLSVSEMIWGLFDPAGTLPHDPATLEIDLSGKAKLDMDLMDPNSAEAMAMSSTPPGELHAININKLLLSVVGAKLSGDGAFTFDNSDMATFDGVPRPEGKVNLHLAGANSLIDKLIQMGFVSDQDAMGARMMMGMFGVPGSEPDTLNSTIEVNSEGHVLANGQRIK